MPVLVSSSLPLFSDRDRFAPLKVEEEEEEEEEKDDEEEEEEEEEEDDDDAISGIILLLLRAPASTPCCELFIHSYNAWANICRWSFLEER